VLILLKYKKIKNKKRIYMTATLKTFIDDMTSLIGTSVAGFFLTLGTVMFFYAVVRFIMKRSSGDTTGLQDAKSMLGWSVLALALMFSIWGVVGLFQTIFKNDTPTGNAILAPSVKVSGSASTGNTTATPPASTVTKKPKGSLCTLSSECTSGNCSGATNLAPGVKVCR
jgi:hypothetical protein